MKARSKFAYLMSSMLIYVGLKSKYEHNVQKQMHVSQHIAPYNRVKHGISIAMLVGTLFLVVKKWFKGMSGVGKVLTLCACGFVLLGLIFGFVPVISIMIKTVVSVVHIILTVAYDAISGVRSLLR